MIWLIVGAVVVLAVILIVVGIRTPQSENPIQERLSELTANDEIMSLEELELSQDFGERILLPFFNQIGEMAQRFTPQATLENARQRLEMAGNPMQMNPAFFLMLRFVFAFLFGGLLILIFAKTGRNWVQGLGVSVIFMLIGFAFPNLWLSGRIKARQKAVFRAMPDALDLLTISVEAGLGFDAAMAKVNEKWINELALEFGRVIQEIRLGKLRRDALRDMADRLGVNEKSEQLGVSMAKVLRIQSDQMRVRRRQMAEEEAHQAPIKMVFPIALLIFPSIMIILLGPAAMLLVASPLGGILGG